MIIMIVMIVMIVIIVMIVMIKVIVMIIVMRTTRMSYLNVAFSSILVINPNEKTLAEPVFVLAGDFRSPQVNGTAK